VRVARYFTLYFIPLFETEHLGDYVECYGCGVKYLPYVLHERPKPQSEQVVSQVRTELESGIAMQTARTKLIKAGTKPDRATDIVEAAAHGEMRTCTACKLGYVKCVKACSTCGQSLLPETGIQAGPPQENAIVRTESDRRRD
jgi:hypothetical protein